MSGAEEVSALRAGGFSEEDIARQIAPEVQALRDGDFSEDDIATHFGIMTVPAFDPAPLRDHFLGEMQKQQSAGQGAEGQEGEPVNEGLAAEMTPDERISRGEQGVPKIDWSILETLEIGLGASIPGMLWNEALPETMIPDNAPAFDRILSQIVTVGADLPVYGVGGALGVAPGGGLFSAATAAGGAFAFHAGVRTVLIEAYENGQIETPQQFWDVLLLAAKDAAKQWNVGAGVGLAGPIAGRVGGKLVKGRAGAVLPTKVAAESAAKFTGELAALVGVGSMVDQEVPTWRSFEDGAAVLLGLKVGHGVLGPPLARAKGAVSRPLSRATSRAKGVVGPPLARVKNSLVEIYKKTGKTPAQVLEDARVDPTIREDLLSKNLNEEPRAYSDKVAPAEPKEVADAVDKKVGKEVAEVLRGKEPPEEEAPRAAEAAPAALASAQVIPGQRGGLRERRKPGGDLAEMSHEEAMKVSEAEAKAAEKKQDELAATAPKGTKVVDPETGAYWQKTGEGDWSLFSADGTESPSTGVRRRPGGYAVIKGWKIEYPAEAPAPRAAAIDSDPIFGEPLGVSRRPVIDVELSRLSEAEFEQRASEVKQRLDNIERHFDENPELADTDSAFRRDMAEAQDRFSAVGAEEFRRLYEVNEPSEIADAIYNLSGLSYSKDTQLQAIVLSDIIAKRGINQEVMDRLRAKADKDPDKIEVLEGKLEQIKEIVKEQETVRRGIADAVTPTPRAAEGAVPAALPKVAVGTAPEGAAGVMEMDVTRGTTRVVLDRDKIAGMAPEERARLVRHEMAHKIETDDALWMKSDTFLWELWEGDKGNPIFEFMGAVTGRTKFDNTQSAEIIAHLYEEAYPTGKFKVEIFTGPHAKEGVQEFPIPPKLMEVLDSIESKLGIWGKKQARGTAPTPRAAEGAAAAEGAPRAVSTLPDKLPQPNKSGFPDPIDIEVYHGSREPFSEFDARRIGETDPGFLGSGIYFYLEEAPALRHGPSVQRRVVHLERPLDVNELMDAVGDRAIERRNFEAALSEYEALRDKGDNYATALDKWEEAKIRQAPSLGREPGPDPGPRPVRPDVPERPSLKDFFTTDTPIKKAAAWYEEAARDAELSFAAKEKAEGMLPQPKHWYIRRDGINSVIENMGYDGAVVRAGGEFSHAEVMVVKPTAIAPEAPTPRAAEAAEVPLREAGPGERPQSPEGFVFYHGTGSKVSLAELSADVGGRHGDAGALGRAIYVTVDPRIAGEYAKMRPGTDTKVLRLGLGEMNIRVVDERRAGGQRLSEELGVEEVPTWDGEVQTNRAWADEFNAKARAAGIDGVYAKDTGEVAVFNADKLVEAPAPRAAEAAEGAAETGAVPPRTDPAGGEPPLPPKRPDDILPPEPPEPPGRPLGRSALDRVGKQISFAAKEAKAPLRARLRKSWDVMMASWFNDIDPMNRAVEAMANGEELDIVENAAQLKQLEFGVIGVARSWLEDSPRDFATSKRVGKSIKNILMPVKNDLDLLSEFLVAKRTLEVGTMMKQVENPDGTMSEVEVSRTGVEMETARLAVEEGRALGLETIQAELVEYQSHVLAYLRDTGVISGDSYDLMIEAGKDYAPLYRLFEPGENVESVSIAGAGTNVINPIFRFKGSERMIIDPIESIINNTYAFISIAQRNNTGARYVQQAVDTGHPEYASPVGPKMRPIKVQNKELQRAIKKWGEGENLSEAESSALEAFAESTFTIFRPDGLRPNKNQIVVFTEGKKSLWQIDPEVYRAYAGAGAEFEGMFWEVLKAPARTLRAGAVLSPEFGGPNLFRDQFTKYLFSDNKGKMFIDTVWGISKLVKQDSAFWDWQAHGGANASLIALDRTYFRGGVQELLDSRLRNSARNVVRNPIEALRLLAELSEAGTRLGEYARAMEGKEGTKSEMLQGALDSRNIGLDFSVMGTQARALNKIIPFFGANMNANWRIVKEFKDHPKRAMARVTTSIVIPSILLHLTHKTLDEDGNVVDKEWYKAVPQWQKDFFWVFKTGGTDAYGDGTIYRLPKPHQLGVVFGTGSERALDMMLENDPSLFETLKSVVEPTINATLPSIIPTTLRPIIEVYANEQLFFKTPVTPAYMEEFLPEYRFKPYTTELAKAMGQLIAGLGGSPGDYGPLKRSPAASPVVLEHFVSSWTGGVGRYVLRSLDAILRKADFLPDPPKPAWDLADIPFIKAFVIRNPTMGTQQMQEFFEVYARNESTIKTIRMLAASGHSDAAQFEREYAGKTGQISLEDLKRSISEVAKSIRMLSNPINKTPEDQKQQLIDGLYLRAHQLAKSGLARVNALEGVGMWRYPDLVDELEKAE